MSDLLQNELLSAYLDGELTAAEQAQVERMMATDPAARRLVEEMRALSVELQDLPRRRLGEDLSGVVLREAERRMLAEGLPGKSTPTPAAPAISLRTFFRRFVLSRAMIWSGLAVAIAVMISIHERSQRDRPADKELALAPAVRTPHAPREGGRTPHAPREEGRTPHAPREAAAVPQPSEGQSRDKNAAEIDASQAVPPMLPHAPREEYGHPRAEREEYAGKPPAREESGKVEGRGGLLPVPAGAAPTAEPSPSAESPATPELSAAPGVPAKRFAVPPPAQAPQVAAARVESKVPLMAAREPAKESAFSVQTVFCNISAEAARKKSFDKLLDANGVEAVRQRGGLIAAAARGKADDLKDAELIYIEATPAQTRAVLAGLAAQPTLFLSVTVKPPQDESARRIVRLFFERGGGLASPERKPVAVKLSETGAAPLQKTLFVLRVGRAPAAIPAKSK